MINIEPTVETLVIAHSGDDRVVHLLTVMPGQVCTTGQPYMDAPEDVPRAVAVRAEKDIAEYEPDEVRKWSERLAKAKRSK